MANSFRFLWFFHLTRCSFLHHLCSVLIFVTTLYVLKYNFTNSSFVEGIVAKAETTKFRLLTGTTFSFFHSLSYTVFAQTWKQLPVPVHLLCATQLLYYSIANNLFKSKKCCPHFVMLYSQYMENMSINSFNLHSLSSVTFIPLF